MNGVSVIICCYNSVFRIRETLRHLYLQKTDASLLWEIVVVNNASTDATEKIILDYWTGLNSSIKLHVINEPRPGLSYAREKGINSSKYDVVIFCDDDNRLFENYVQVAFDLMRSNSHIGAAGGEGIAVTDGELPYWFKDHKLFASYRQADKSGELSGTNAALYGAGMVVRREAIEHLNSLGAKFLLSDRTGSNLTSGGDYELCYLIKLTGYKLWFDDRLKFFHYMPPQRLTHDYLFKLINNVAYSGMNLVLYHYAINGKKVTRFTWLFDVAYRINFLIKNSIKAFFVKDKFQRGVIMSSSWSSLKGVVHQFGKYRKLTRSIIIISQAQKKV